MVHSVSEEASVGVQGTAKRWEVVTQYVRTRTQEEVLDMVKHGLKSRKGMQTKQEQFSIAKKRQANTTIKSDPTGRMESFTDVDVNISGAALQCWRFSCASLGLLLLSALQRALMMAPDSTCFRVVPITPVVLRLRCVMCFCCY